jgi:hypothetical protein
MGTEICFEKAPGIYACPNAWLALGERQPADVQEVLLETGFVGFGVGRSGLEDRSARGEKSFPGSQVIIVSPARDVAERYGVKRHRVRLHFRWRSGYRRPGDELRRC